MNRLFVFLGCLMVSSSAYADVKDLLSHKAVYELTLLNSKGMKGPSAAQGLLSYDFAGSACEGYTTTFRQMMQILPAEGQSHVTDMNSTTFEDAGYKNFHFKIKTKNDDEMVEDIDGSAARGADGSLAVKLIKPKSIKVDLVSGVDFPTQQMEEVIVAARKGETTLSRQVYDGTDGGQIVYDTLTVIGKKAVTVPSEAAAQNNALKNTDRWPVTISYYDHAKKDTDPAYVLSFDVYENGVSRNLVLDYGDFSLKGELKTFEPKVVDATNCKKQ